MNVDDSICANVGEAYNILFNMEQCMEHQSRREVQTRTEFFPKLKSRLCSLAALEAVLEELLVVASFSFGLLLVVSTFNEELAH